MTTSDNRLIVVRAWRDSDRLIIRLLISAGPTALPVESVFTDIDSASQRLADVLGDLLAAGGTPDRATPVDEPGRATRYVRENPADPHTKR